MVITFFVRTTFWMVHLYSFISTVEPQTHKTKARSKFESYPVFISLFYKQARPRKINGLPKQTHESEIRNRITQVFIS